VILKEQVTGEKQKERSIVSALLRPVLVKGRIRSADGLHTQHPFCFRVRRWEGDSVLIATGKQATRSDDWRLFCSERLLIAGTGGRPALSTKDMGGGRSANGERVPP